MKKISFLVLCLIFISFSLLFSACGNDNENYQHIAQTMEHSTASELSKVDNADSLDDETLKALSIIIRTRLYVSENTPDAVVSDTFASPDIFTDTINKLSVANSNTNELDNLNNSNDADNSTQNSSSEPLSDDLENISQNNDNNNNIKTNELNNSKTKIAENLESTEFQNNNDNAEQKSKNADLSRFEEIAKQTSGQILCRGKSPIYSRFKGKRSIAKNSENDEWQVVIKKSDILKFMSKNGIALSSISDISASYTEDGSLSSLLVAGKEITYAELASEFNLSSPFIEKIEPKNSVIVIYGKGRLDAEYFDVEKARSLASSGKTHEQLLKHFFYDYTLKTM